MTSLEGRLHLGLALSLALLIGGAWWLGHIALHHTANAFVLARLEHDTEGWSVRSDSTHREAASGITAPDARL
jgi:hypothetical protein